jgi:cytochrome c553
LFDVKRKRRPKGRRFAIREARMRVTSAVVLMAGFLAGLVTVPAAGRAADAPPGAAACSGCHAVNAAAETPVPKINGRSADETVALMAAFRTGARPSTVMNRIAKGFSEDETRAIAAWLASQR